MLFSELTEFSRYDTYVQECVLVHTYIHTYIVDCNWLHKLLYFWFVRSWGDFIFSWKDLKAGPGSLMDSGVYVRMYVFNMCNMLTYICIYCMQHVDARNTEVQQWLLVYEKLFVAATMLHAECVLRTYCTCTLQSCKNDSTPLPESACYATSLRQIHTPQLHTYMPEQQNNNELML